MPAKSDFNLEQMTLYTIHWIMPQVDAFLIVVEFLLERDAWHDQVRHINNQPQMTSDKTHQVRPLLVLKLPNTFHIDPCFLPFP